ncbi:reverse transcriptase domain-containing protein [Tanacetum coccineum]
MPFGLRNAKATYQHLVDKEFHKQIGRILEVYVDDLVIKSRTENEIVRDMEETFQNLIEINMKLNPKKCTFGIDEGMFLGYKVSTMGLKVCPDKVLSRPEVAGRLQKWSIELGEYAIHYRPRVSVKGKILTDFIVEQPEEDSPDTLIEEAEELPEPWILFTDGSSCTDGSGAGLILTNPEGMELTYALRFRFDATNNEAKYEALIAGLKIAEQMGVKASKFKAFSIKQIPRSENKKADALSKTASTSFAHLSKQVLVEEVKEKSISATKVLAVVEEEGDIRMTPIFKYLTDETLPAEAKKAKAIKRKSWRFSIINGTLYKKSFHRPWLRHMICHGKSPADWLLLANHARGRKNANKSKLRLPSPQACPKEFAAKAKPNYIPMGILQVGN